MDKNNGERKNKNICEYERKGCGLSKRSYPNMISQKIMRVRFSLSGAHQKIRQSLENYILFTNERFS